RLPPQTPFPVGGTQVENGRADPNQIAVGQRRLFDLLAVEQSPVGLREVEDPVVSLNLLDARVRTRNRGVVEREVVADKAAYGQPFALDHNGIESDVFANNDKFAHSGRWRGAPRSNDFSRYYT